MPRPSPYQLIDLWHRTPSGRGIEDRAIAFGNRVASFCLDEEEGADGRVALKSLDLPTMAYSALRRAGYQYVDQIKGFNATRLAEIKNIGPKMAARILDEISNVKP